MAESVSKLLKETDIQVQESQSPKQDETQKTFMTKYIFANNKK